VHYTSWNLANCCTTVRKIALEKHCIIKVNGHHTSWRPSSKNSMNSSASCCKKSENLLCFTASNVYNHHRNQTWWALTKINVNITHFKVLESWRKRRNNESGGGRMHDSRPLVGIPSVLWYCWFDNRKAIQLKNKSCATYLQVQEETKGKISAVQFWIFINRFGYSSVLD